MENSIISAMENRIEDKKKTSVSKGEIKNLPKSLVEGIGDTMTDYDAVDIAEEMITNFMSSKGFILNDCKCSGCKCGK